MVNSEINLKFAIADSALDRRPLGHEEARELLLMYGSLSKSDKDELKNKFPFTVMYVINFFE